MIAGTGLIGVAKDNLPRIGVTPGLTATFAEIELDTETGKFKILEMLCVADCGTVLHPQGLAHQIRGGNVMGIGLARLERHVYDPKLGIPTTVLLYQAKLPGYLDVPVEIGWGAVEKPDPQNPVGVKGVGGGWDCALPRALRLRIPRTACYRRGGRGWRWWRRRARIPTEDDFSGAVSVVSSLGEPGEPHQHLAGLDLAERFRERGGVAQAGRGDGAGAGREA